jgi:hypothetical protein
MHELPHALPVEQTLQQVVVLPPPAGLGPPGVALRGAASPGEVGSTLPHELAPTATVEVSSA